jgi:protein TonB
MLSAEIQNKNKNVALTVTVVVHALMLLLLFFFVSFQAPDPPLSAGGVELNFGLDEAGYGEIQSLAPANDSKNTEDAKPGPPDNQPSAAVPAEEQVAESVKESPQPQPEAPMTTEDESPVVVKEKTKEKPVEKKIEKPVEAVKKPVEKVVEKPAEKKVEKKEVDKRAVMEGGAGGIAGTKKETPGNNNGDKPGKVGDQGDPRGTLNGKALYGDPGTGGGSGGGNGAGTAISITGWAPDNKPKIDKDQVDEGKVVFRIKIDDQGNIISVVVIEKTMSTASVEICKREVEKLTFTPTSENPNPAPTSTGTITFIIKSR